jgi:hypothetical protein
VPAEGNRFLIARCGRPLRASSVAFAVPVGSFSRVTLAENGVATVAFNTGTTTYLGSVTITAFVEGVAASMRRVVTFL